MWQLLRHCWCLVQVAAVLLLLLQEVLLPWILLWQGWQKEPLNHPAAAAAAAVWVLAVAAAPAVDQGHALGPGS
jgi:hypothetical protein